MGSEFKILLYILIGFGYLFSRFYRKELKKQNEKGINKRPHTSSKMEEIFKELQKTLNIPDLEQPVKKAKPKEKVKPMPVEGGEKRLHRKPVNAHSKLKYYKPIKPSRLKKENNMIEEHFQLEDESVVASRPYDFDPKKAILYSEIIKRPQY